MVSTKVAIDNVTMNTTISSIVDQFLSSLQSEGLVKSGLLRSFGNVEAKEIVRAVYNMSSDLTSLATSTQFAKGDDVTDTGRDSQYVTEFLAVPTCLAIMCAHMGHKIPAHCNTISDIDNDVLLKLRDHTTSRIGYSMYSSDDPRNHVVPVKAIKSVTADFTIDGGDGSQDCVHGITSAQEFFNPGGRFYKIKFFADTMADTGFGADASRRRGNDNANYPPVPESVNGSDVESGTANVTRGVVRPKKRVIKSVTDYDRTSAKLRNYAVSGTTMFNNVDEMFLDTISRDFAQEIIEHLFQTWGLPSEEPETMRYAEDVLFAFIVARTASNKADYNVAYDVPTKSGTVEADFSVFSALLADHYGITRRNFSRGIANDVRDYLRRPENQAIKSRAAARIGADPQYGHLCFDGSTECSNMTTSEQKFTRVLEAKNLYENDAILAEGASSTLMEGIHGGVRSNVAR